jgi:phosphoenolpyruvate synthase/pyruvate phosphate dikinase
MPTKCLICAISDVGAADRSLVGGKGASLGELIRAGIRVPAGYVVTVDAFRLALRALDPVGEIAREIGRLPAGDRDAVARVSREVRARITGSPIPGDVREQVTAAYRSLGAAGAASAAAGGVGEAGVAGEVSGAGEVGGAAAAGGVGEADVAGEVSGAGEVGGAAAAGGVGKAGVAGEVSGAGEVGGAAAAGGAGEVGGAAAAGGAGEVGGAAAAGGSGAPGGAGEGGVAGKTGGGGPAASDVPVAVRSSAIGEDSAEASFAGLQDTYLWVRGADSLLGRVRDCWASLYNAEAVGYRRRVNMDEHDLAMAVVVQRMVEPRCAGVMFTCSPTTGDRSVIAIEGTWGLGSALVSGDVTPDSFVISKVTGEVVRRSVAVKLRLHRAGPGGVGVAADDVPGPQQDRACLGDAELAALARLGRQVEDHYGAPQDIEWAIAAGAGPGETAVLLLQSRPETVWARRHAGPLATRRPRAVDHVFEQLGRVNVVRPER